MSHAPWNDETAHLDRPAIAEALHAPRHSHQEPDDTVVRSPLFAQDEADLPGPRKPAPQERAEALRAHREFAWTVAGWLLVAVLVVWLFITAALALVAWRLGGPLNGGHP